MIMCQVSENFEKGLIIGIPTIERNLHMSQQGWELWQKVDQLQCNAAKVQNGTYLQINQKVTSGMP